MKVIYNDQLVYKVVIWAFFRISLWKEKVALNPYSPICYCEFVEVLPFMVKRFPDWSTNIKTFKARLSQVTIIKYILTNKYPHQIYII